jgi:hypothetical protein
VVPWPTEQLPPPESDALRLIVWVLGGWLALVKLWLLAIWRENAAYRRRNEQLSDWLLETVERASAERLRMTEQHSLQLDSSLRAQNEQFTSLLAKAMNLRAGSSGS